MADQDFELPGDDLAPSTILQEDDGTTDATPDPSANADTPQVAAATEEKGKKGKKEKKPKPPKVKRQRTPRKPEEQLQGILAAIFIILAGGTAFLFILALANVETSVTAPATMFGMLGMLLYGGLIGPLIYGALKPKPSR